jgi:hypothetical protein
LKTVKNTVIFIFTKRRRQSLYFLFYGVISFALTKALF